MRNFWAGSSGIQSSRRTIWLTNSISHVSTHATLAPPHATIAQLPAFQKPTSLKWPNALGTTWIARMFVALLPQRWPGAADTSRTYARFAHPYVKHAPPSARSTSTSTASNALKHAALALPSAERWNRHLGPWRFGKADHCFPGRNVRRHQATGNRHRFGQRNLHDENFMSSSWSVRQPPAKMTMVANG
jgi:hypothetical protein